MYEIQILQPCKNHLDITSRVLISDNILKPVGKGYLTRVEFADHLSSFPEITVNNVEKCNTFSIGASGFRGQYMDCYKTPFDPLFVFNLGNKIPRSIEMKLYASFTANNTMSYFNIVWAYDQVNDDGSETPIKAIIYNIHDGQYSTKSATESRYYNIDTHTYKSIQNISSLDKTNLIQLDVVSNMKTDMNIKNSRLEFYQSNTFNTYSQVYGAVYISYLQINY